MKRRHDKKVKQPKKSIGNANVLPKRTKQVVNKSIGKQNIQIHIDLSKRTSKKTSPTPSSRASPIINLPPPVYGMSAPSSSSSSMMDALNLILAQNTKFENALRNETKKANIITGEKERVNQPTLADEINKNVGKGLQDLYGVQIEAPLYSDEEEIFSENPQLEKEYNSRKVAEAKPIFSLKKEDDEEETNRADTFSFSSPIKKRPPPLVPTQNPERINLSKMKISELQGLALQKGIDIYKEESQETIGKGKGYKPTKNKQQLIEELSKV